MSKLLSNCYSEYVGAILVVPITAFALLSFILTWCHEKAVVLIGDYGVVHQDEVKAYRDFGATSWSNMRFPVNFSLFQHHVAYYRGFMDAPVYHTEYPIVLLSYGIPAFSLQRTRLAFRRWADCQSPEQIYTLHTAAAKESEASIDLVLFLVRLAQSDPDCLWQLRSLLLKSDTMIADEAISLHDIKLQLENVQEVLMSEE